MKLAVAKASQPLLVTDQSLLKQIHIIHCEIHVVLDHNIPEYRPLASRLEILRSYLTFLCSVNNQRNLTLNPSWTFTDQGLGHQMDPEIQRSLYSDGALILCAVKAD